MRVPGNSITHSCWVIAKIVSGDTDALRPYAAFVWRSAKVVARRALRSIWQRAAPSRPRALALFLRRQERSAAPPYSIFSEV